MQPLKTIALTVSGLFVLPAAAQTKEWRPSETGPAMMQLQSSPLSAQRRNHDSIWQNLRRGFVMGEVNSELVRSHEERLASNAAYFNRTINRSLPYMYHIVKEVEKRGMPAEIALLPFIESAYVTQARSHVGASGLWQFMPATGRRYGLAQTSLYDGRHDVYAATNAALNYLQYLYGMFGDWSLALAAYNWGEGSVSRAVKQAQAANLPPTYENLKMPAETRHYVPKLLAVRNLVNMPQAFGIALPEIKNEPYFKAVKIEQPLDIRAAAQLADISENEFLALNPAFKTPVLTPYDGGQLMLLPVNAVGTFEKNYRSTDPKKLLSWDIFTPHERMTLKQLAEKTGVSEAELKRINNIKGKHIAAGSSIVISKNNASGLQAQTAGFAQSDPFESNAFHSISVTSAAQSSGIAPPVSVSVDSTVDFVAQGKRAAERSGLDMHRPIRQPETTAGISADTVLVQNGSVKTNGLMHTSAKTVEKTVTRTVKYTVKKGDTLISIAKRHNIAAADLIAANGIKNKTVRIGQVLKIRTSVKVSGSPSEKTAATAVATHKVKSGETLSSIARLHHISVADLTAANNIKGNNIKPGQVLKIGGKAAANGKTAAKTAAAKVSGSQTPARYTVKKGDTLISIARRHQTDLNTLKRLNPNSSTIKPGQVIRLK